MKPTIREVLDSALGDDHYDAVLAEREAALRLAQLRDSERLHSEAAAKAGCRITRHDGGGTQHARGVVVWNERAEKAELERDEARKLKEEAYTEVERLKVEVKRLEDDGFMRIEWLQRAEQAEAALAAAREEIEGLRERWACIECGRTPSDSGDLYGQICHGCHRCMECCEPSCTVCGFDVVGLRKRSADLKLQLAAANERALNLCGFIREHAAKLPWFQIRDYVMATEKALRPAAQAVQAKQQHDPATCPACLAGRDSGHVTVAAQAEEPKQKDPL